MEAKTLETALADHSLVLDVGGEGRHEEAWNLNPSAVKTLGSERGQPIPRHIPGRADAIPLPDDSVDYVIVERTPLRLAALHELVRVVKPGGRITLRHVHYPENDQHSHAREIIPGQRQHTFTQLGELKIQETRFQIEKPARPSTSAASA